jgi:ubiquinone/menaquinone biosynthesis C-methylase UbiE
MSREPGRDTWEQGDAYERYIGRWSRQVAPRFLSWLDVPAGKRWLDVGCGTGALCAAILDRCAPASLTGVDPSEGFLKTAASHLPAHVSLRLGIATALQLYGVS